MDWKDELLNQYEDEFEDVYQFDPPDGWRSIVESLTEYIRWHNKVHDMLVKIYAAEKRHGGLRFTIHHWPSGSNSTIPEEIFGAVHLAETLSCKTCEICGAPGNFTKQKLVEKLVLGTYCDEHIPTTGN
jgi:hypothetical protein